MVTYVEYLKSILSRIVDSYNALEAIEDKPGDLKKIEKEMLKINGFVRVISNKIEIEKIPLADFKITKKKFKADAIITNQEKLPIGILTADCVPILIYDNISNTIAAVHAGWKGAYKGIVNKVINFMLKKGCKKEN